MKERLLGQTKINPKEINNQKIIYIENQLTDMKKSIDKITFKKYKNKKEVLYFLRKIQTQLKEERIV